MQIPITRAVAINACSAMKVFHTDLVKLYDTHGMDLASNRGRRNILMSAPMEHFLAKAIRDTLVFESVESDGRTGEADITVFTKNGNIEIECKLTSPHQSSGSICFQTDHDTLLNKGSLDYVYIISDADFKKFCVVYFKDLTTDEFRSLSPGARGKVQMYKWAGMKKAEVLVGQAVSSNDVKIKKIKSLLAEKTDEKQKQIFRWKKLLQDTDLNTKKHKELSAKISRGLEYIDNLVNNADEQVRITSTKNARYSFLFEEV